MKMEKYMCDDELRKKIAGFSEVVIFGATNIGWYLFGILGGGYIAICDNSVKKQQDTNVMSVENAVNLYKNAIYLITSSIHEQTMKKQLLSLGIPEEHIMMAITKEALDYDYNCKKKKKVEPLPKIQFEVDLASHCNLNCKCCSQFSCIAEEEFIDIKVMERDFKRLGELFEGNCERIYLIGGEPLLHPDVEKCMKIARSHFPIGKISVFTNGLLLLNCGEIFWKTCREYNITIIVTKYPINFDYEGIVQKVEKENVSFEFFGASQDFKYMTRLNMDIKGRQNAEKSWVECKESNNCVKLKNGKIYTCTRPAAIYKFNKYFNMNFEVSPKDYIDIYKAESGEEILRKMAQPIPFCRYCNPIEGRIAVEWGATDKSVYEWICDE